MSLCSIDVRCDPDCAHDRPIRIQLHPGGWAMWFTVEHAEAFRDELTAAIKKIRSLAGARGGESRG